MKVIAQYNQLSCSVITHHAGVITEWSSVCVGLHPIGDLDLMSNKQCLSMRQVEYYNVNVFCHVGFFVLADLIFVQCHGLDLSILILFHLLY